MDFTFTEEQKMLASSVKDFIRKEADFKSLATMLEKPISSSITKDELREYMPWDLLSKGHDLGLAQLAVPERYGGGGIGPGQWLTLGKAAEEAGYWGGPLGHVFTMMWKNCITVTYAAESVQNEFFPAFMNNRKTWLSIALTEPEHGSDVVLPYDDPNGKVGKVFAEQDGDYWVINGEKQFSTGGGQADWVIVAARTSKKTPFPKSMTVFMIPPNTPGMSMERCHVLMANVILQTVALTFENCRVHKRFVISPLNEGSQWFSQALMTPKMMHWPGQLAISKRIYEEILEYAKTRIQGDKPLIQHPNNGIMLAEVNLLLQTAQLYMYKTLWDIDQINPIDYKQLPTIQAHYFNYYYKKVSWRLMEIGLEIYGGMGIMREMTFEPWSRAFITYLHAGGTPISQLIKASREL